MPQPRPLVVLTRPEDRARAFASRLGDAIEVLIAPLMEVVACDWSLPEAPVGGLLLASPAAVQAAAGQARLAGLPVFCVGRATAQAAEAAGFAPLHVAPTGAALLGDGAALDRMRGLAPVLVLRGRHAAVPFAQALARAGIAAEERIVYDQRALPLSKAARARIQQADRLVLTAFSPRSARILADALKGLALPEGTVLVTLADYGVNASDFNGLGQVIVADEPSGEAMRRAVLAAAQGNWPRL